jgi:uncharacterized protein YbjT (DUF2867 family)
MSRVLVTGATGTVGSRAVAELRRRGLPVRAFVRDPARAAALLGREVELAVGDFGDPGSLRRALRAVDEVLLSSANHPRQAEHEIAVIDAAAAAGVRRVVKVSAVGARAGSPEAFADWHGRSERHLAASGVPAVVLRAGFFMSNLLASAESVREAGRLFAAVDGARIAMVDPQDVAAAAAAVLTQEGHDGRAYLLTGPEALTYDEVAGELATATGQTVEFVDVPDEAALEAMLASGMPDWLASGVGGVFRQLRAGVNAQATDVVRILTGRDPRSLADFLRDNAAAFGPRAERATS